MSRQAIICEGLPFIFKDHIGIIPIKHFEQAGPNEIRLRLGRGLVVKGLVSEAYEARPKCFLRWMSKAICRYCLFLESRLSNLKGYQNAV